MSRWELSWTTALQALGLVAVLGFVFTVQYVPHLNTFDNPPPGGEEDTGLAQLGQAWANYVRDNREGFPWSIHVDEQYHASVISQVQRLDRLITGSPYVEEPGEVSAIGSLYGGVHETGYHVLFAQIQDVTGIDTHHLYQWGPAVWMTITAFGVYALVRPHPAAIPAAAFVGLSPTTLRFLGTGFLVPVGFSLAWLPAVAILTEPAKKRAATAVLGLTTVVWAFFVHLVAGFACVAILLLAALFSGGRERKAALTLFGLAILPVAWLWRSFQSGVQAQLEREATLPVDFTIFDNFGLITMLIWVLGAGLYWLDPPREDDVRPEVAAVATLSIVALALIVSSVTFDLNRYATYSRMHPIYFFCAAIPVGYAIAVLARRSREGALALADRFLPEGTGTRRRAVLGVGVALVVGLSAAAPAASQAVGYHLEEPYYRIMDERTWDSYETVEANLSDEPEYDVFLSDPWQSPWLFEKTGMVPHTVGLPGGSPGNAQDWRDYLQGQTSARMYVMNDITVVAGPAPPPGDFWEREARDVWVMEEAYAEQIQRIRDGKGLQASELPEG